MSGSRWSDLIRALQENLNKIKPLQNAFVTIINFACSARIIYERVPASSVNISNVTYGCGGTDFSSAFSKVYSVAQKTIHQETIAFMFMTDGGDTYP